VEIGHNWHYRRGSQVVQGVACYVVSLPFITGTKELLPTNFNAAEKRLKAATHKLKQMGDFGKYDTLLKLWEGHHSLPFLEVNIIIT